MTLLWHDQVVAARVRAHMPDESTEPGYCQCGCGGLAPIAKMTNNKWGHVKGQPVRFIHGHHKPHAKFEFAVDDHTGCWTWQGSTDKRSGYGYTYARGRHTLAHRASYERFVGPIPAGLQIDHLCRNRACVNPAHLEPVTGRENVLRGVSLAAQNARKDRCKRGHRFDADNTYVASNGERHCRACHATHERNRRARLRAGGTA